MFSSCKKFGEDDSKSGSGSFLISAACVLNDINATSAVIKNLFTCFSLILKMLFDELLYFKHIIADGKSTSL